MRIRIPALHAVAETYVQPTLQPFTHLCRVRRAPRRHDSPSCAFGLQSSGRTPLHWACLHGAPDCAAQLQACDPAGWEARDKDGATPAHLAAACGHVAVLSTLRESLATRRERRLLMAAKDAQGANPRQVCIAHNCAAALLSCRNLT
eukprot:COSAG05_NODE_62_length_23051_cov_19.660291_16_plen_147_part_00